MLDVALGVVREIAVRPDPTSKIEARQTSIQNQPQPKSLPRITPQISATQIVLNSPQPVSTVERAEQLFGAGAKRLGQSPHPWSPPIRDLIEYGKNNSALVKFKEQIPQSTPSALSRAYAWFFIPSAGRKVSTAVLGNPTANAALMVYATTSITKMLVASLSEDLYGKVVAGVPTAVRTFTVAANTIENLLQQNPDANDDDIEEVLIVLAHLQSGLKELLSAFQLYLTDVGLGVTELNAAKRAAGLVPREGQQTAQPIQNRPSQQQRKESTRNTEQQREPVQRDIFQAYREQKRKVDEKRKDERLRERIEAAPAEETVPAEPVRSGLTRRGGKQSWDLGRNDRRPEMQQVK